MNSKVVNIVLSIIFVFLVVDISVVMSIHFKMPSYAVAEGESVEICVVVELNINLSSNVTIGIAVDDSGDSKTGLFSDYLLPTPSNLTFVTTGSDHQISQCVNLMTIQDIHVEGNHTLTLMLHNTTTGTAIMPQQTTVITIIDDDVLNIYMEPTIYVIEGRQAKVQITIMSPSYRNAECGQTMVGYTTIDISATSPDDYRKFSSVILSKTSLTITTIRVNTVGDDIDEFEESFQMMITNVTTECPFKIGNNVSMVIIRDQESINTSVELLSPEIVVKERDETIDVCVELLLQNSSSVLDHDILFALCVNGDTAKFGVDFMPPMAFTNLRFNIGDEHRERECISVAIVNDIDFEDEEFFFVSIETILGHELIGGEQWSTKITINDTQDARVSITLSDELITENIGRTQVCIDPGISGRINATLSVSLVVHDGKAVLGEDYALESGDLVMIYSEWDNPQTKCLNFTIIDDNISEGDQEFHVSISSVQPSWVLGFPTAVTITIIDDEAPVAVRLRPAVKTTLSEGMSSFIIVDTTETPSGGFDNITVTLTVSSKDDVTLSNTIVLLTSTSSSVLIEIRAIDDSVYEESEEVTVTIASLQPPSAAVIGDPSINTFTILDNHDAEVRFVMEEITVQEDNGSVSICVESGVTGGFETDLIVSLSARDGNGGVIPDGIFIPEPFKINFHSNQTTSTSCTDIFILRNAKLENVTVIIITIERAGNKPYAMITSPSSLMLIIQTTKSVTSASDDSGSLDLPWIITILSISIATITIVGAIVGIIVYSFCCSGTTVCRCRRKKEDSDDPVYDDIYVTGQSVELNRPRYEENEQDFKTSLNEAYVVGITKS